MPLPTISVPVYEVTIPSTEEKVKIRPFLVKEEKILLMALESGNETEMLEAIKQVVKNCLDSPVDVEKLAVFDLEFLFLRLRAISIGQVVEPQYKCRNTVGDDICGNIIKIPINLESVEVEKDPAHSEVIMLTDTVGIKMKYPKMEMIKKLSSPKNASKDDIAISMEVIAECIESVFDGDNAQNEFTSKEINQFLDGLTQGMFAKIQSFFETMPKLRHTVHFNCEQCGHEEDITLEGLQSFFV